MKLLIITSSCLIVILGLAQFTAWMLGFVYIPLWLPGELVRPPDSDGKVWMHEIVVIPYILLEIAILAGIIFCLMGLAELYYKAK